jgi:hypothetical protein
LVNIHRLLLQTGNARIKIRTQLTLREEPR